MILSRSRLADAHSEVASRLGGYDADVERLTAACKREPYSATLSLELASAHKAARMLRRTLPERWEESPALHRAYSTAYRAAVDAELAAAGDATLDDAIAELECALGRRRAA